MDAKHIIESLGALIEGAIRLDRTKLWELERDLSRFLRDRYDPDTRHKYGMGNRVDKRFEVSMPDVRGVDKRFVIHLRTEPGRRRTIAGGRFVEADPFEDHDGTIEVLIGKKMTLDEMWDAISRGEVADDLRTVLVHELTHALDVITKGEMKSYPGSPLVDPVGHYNHPTEVRARLGEVQDHVLRKTKSRYHRRQLKGLKGQALVMHLLKGSSAWQNASPHLTPKNKRKFYQLVHKLVGA